MPQSNFNRVLLAAIEEGLASLGDSPREAIFYHLESTFQLQKKDIPLNLNEFKSALEQIFGPGAPYLEKMITHRLCEKLHIDVNVAEQASLIVVADDARRLNAARRR